MAKRGVGSLLRLEQIARVLAEYELFHWLDVLELKGYLPFHRRRKVHTFDTQPKTLRAAFERLGGAFLKLGQVLALRPDLVGSEYSREFEKLLAAVPPESWESIVKTIENAAPKGLSTFQQINRSPIASGSIAQVHEARLPDGTRVALKIRRQNAPDQFANDIHLMEMLARRYTARHGTAVWDAVAVVEEFKQYTERELNLQHELRNMQVFAQNFSGSTVVHIPKVYPELSSEALLVMEYVEGERLLNLRQEQSVQRRKRIVRQIVDMAYQQLFLDGFFHADLHAGNIFVERQKIALLDFGIVGYVDRELKEQLLALFRVLAMGDIAGTAEVLRRLHQGEEPNMPMLREGLYFALREYYQQSLSNIPVGKVLLECIDTARRARLRLPAQLVLFAKSIVTLEGVCAAIDPEFNVVASAKPFLRKMERRAFSSENIARRLKNSTLQGMRALAELPNFTRRLEQHFRTLDARIIDIDETFGRATQGVKRAAQLLAAAILLAAVLGASALLLRTAWYTEAVLLVGTATSSILFITIVWIWKKL
ncbi:MAG TPA: AarF/UbiB family protein [Candidatus Nanoarchaeia archaeon]|nr:AarF/UbiB family protein [Candidatus Nanoarchaeia archaeon]